MISIYITEKGAEHKISATDGDPSANKFLNKTYLGGRPLMYKAVRCSIVLSMLCLMVLGEQSEQKQQQSNDVVVGDYKSSIFSTKINVNASLMHSTTDFHVNHNIEIVDEPQVGIVDKNTTQKMSNIGIISNSDYQLLCQLVAAEAENQPLAGKRAVVAVVLNRVDYGYPFEDTIEGVIFQEGQFSCISDGRFFDAYSYISDEDREAVEAELLERSDSEILFFTAGKYGAYGTPAYQIGDHYFSTR